MLGTPLSFIVSLIAESLSTFGAVSQRSGLSGAAGLSAKRSNNRRQFIQGIAESLRALARSLSTFGAVSQAQPVSQRSGLISRVVSPKSVSWCHTHGDRLRIGYLLMWLRPIEECVIESIDSYRCRHLPKQIGNFRPAS